MASISLRGLTRRYDGAARPALDGLDLEVADGEVLVLVGPSGCGKSTALRLIAGLDTPTAGSIRLDDRELSGVAPQERDVAMVFQGYALYPHLTVRENIAFPLKMRRVATAERARRVADAASLLGLSKLLDRRPAELSGGERQRVAMGRALVRAPKAFLFDEPLSNLDAALRAELRVELAALVRRLGTTSVYVTHDHVEAMTLGDRIAVLRGGLLEQVGTPREVYESPATVFVAGFLGSPPINLVDLAREGDRLRGPGIDLPAPAALSGRARIKAGIRPEHLALAAAGAGAGWARIEATVAAVEPLGPETHLTLDARGTRLCTRAPGFDAPRPGTAVVLAVDPARVLWFDAETGERVAVEPVPAQAHGASSAPESPALEAGA